jgi:hypothetical protein
MESYKRLNEIPKSYFSDLPLSKSQAKLLLHENNKYKRDFNGDEDLKRYLTTKYIIKQIDIIINYTDNDEIKQYLITKLLSKMIQ